MSRINGDKARAAVEAKRRAAMRLKSRALRAAAAAPKSAKKSRKS